MQIDPTLADKFVRAEFGFKQIEAHAVFVDFDGAIAAPQKGDLVCAHIAEIAAFEALAPRRADRKLARLRKFVGGLLCPKFIAKPLCLRKFIIVFRRRARCGAVFCIGRCFIANVCIKFRRLLARTACVLPVRILLARTARFRLCHRIFAARACRKIGRIERLVLAFCRAAINIRADLHAYGSKFLKSRALVASDHASFAGAVNIDDAGIAKRAQPISDRRT